jgi:hypothetical protein
VHLACLPPPNPPIPTGISSTASIPPLRPISRATRMGSGCSISRLLWSVSEKTGESKTEDSVLSAENGALADTFLNYGGKIW